MFAITFVGFSYQTYGYIMKLNEASVGSEYIIEEVLSSDESLCSQFYKLGIYPGAVVVMKRKAPLFRDPILYQVGESQIALTKFEASLLKVSTK